MDLPGPSGTCQGQPCHTPTDIATTQAMIDDRNDQKALLQQDIAVIDGELVTLEHYLGDQMREACPA